jgi:hypothetical protein
MKPKFRGVPALATLVAAVLAAGLETGAKGDDDSPIHKIMDRVHTRNRAIGKGLRAPTALEAAGRKGMAADAGSLIVPAGKPARSRDPPKSGRSRSWTGPGQWTTSSARRTTSPGSSRTRGPPGPR